MGNKTIWMPTGQNMSFQNNNNKKLPWTGQGHTCKSWAVMEDKKISNGYYAQQRCICFSICFANTVLVKESTSAVSPGIQPLATSFKDLNTTVALLCYKLLLVFFFFFPPASSCPLIWTIPYLWGLKLHMTVCLNGSFQFSLRSFFICWGNTN